LIGEELPTQLGNHKHAAIGLRLVGWIYAS
jgi:hypothetical protein